MTAGAGRRLWREVKKNEPSRVLYNGLTPLLVAVVEYYFLNVFLVLAEHDSFAREKLAKSRTSRPLTGAELRRVADGQLSPARAIAREYSFQSVDSLAKTYKEWFGFDIRRALAVSRRIGGRKVTVLRALTDLIERRHSVVHRLELDGDYSVDDISFHVQLVRVVIDQITHELGLKYNFTI